MNLSKILKNVFLVMVFGLVVTACATKKTVKTSDTSSSSTTSAAKEEKAEPIKQLGSLMQGDVYIGSDTVGELASGVPDRVFFATNESILTTKSRDTLRKQAAWLRQNPGVTVVVEGHADERGTREYNLALGEQRAKTVAELLIINGVPSSKISTVSYGEEKPAVPGSNENAWSKNRRALVKTF